MTNYEWQKTSPDNLPEMGRKVLCFTQGDVEVRVRVFDDWFLHPYSDSCLADLKAPEYWTYINYPEEGFTGHIRISAANDYGNLKTFEELINGNESEKHTLDRLYQSMLRFYEDTHVDG